MFWKTISCVAYMSSARNDLFTNNRDETNGHGEAEEKNGPCSSSILVRHEDVLAFPNLCCKKKGNSYTVRKWFRDFPKVPFSFSKHA
jgi:hypothetical protein